MVPSSKKTKSRRLTRRWHFGWVEFFVLVLYLSPGLLFVPGTGGVRLIIRSLPYLVSLGLLFMHAARARHEKLAAGGTALLLALGLLVIGLAHPQTPLQSGIAQVVFQISIAAPIFWVSSLVTDQEKLRRIVWLAFVANAMSAVMGVLQVLNPAVFMPPELSVDETILSQLTFTGFNGLQLVRPPGLTDLPAGAALGGVVSALFGLTMAVQGRRKLAVRALYVLLAGIGFVALFLTQVRSLLIMLVGAIVFFVFLLLRQGRMREARRMGLLGSGLIGGTFAVAAVIGGAAVVQRMLEETIGVGLFSAYRSNRGSFLTQTLTSELPRYPLGAGVGRWGMMQQHFGSGLDGKYAEIQLTGWLYDGGVLMWILYGSAIVLAVAYAYRTAVSHPDREIAMLAAMIGCLELMIAGLTLAGPTFNSPLGMQFWFFAAALYGAAGMPRRPGAAGGARLPAAPGPAVAGLRRGDGVA